MTHMLIFFFHLPMHLPPPPYFCNTPLIFCNKNGRVNFDVSCKRLRAAEGEIDAAASECNGLSAGLARLRPELAGRGGGRRRSESWRALLQLASTITQAIHST